LKSVAQTFRFAGAGRPEGLRYTCFATPGQPGLVGVSMMSVVNLRVVLVSSVISGVTVRFWVVVPKAMGPASVTG
jgi:hypothetical protein